jgi:hypothetical protein
MQPAPDKRHSEVFHVDDRIDTAAFGARHHIAGSSIGLPSTIVVGETGLTDSEKGRCGG